MLFLIRGHRGVGKTSLLNRLENYFPDSTSIDLDEEISKSEARSISSIFENEGEAFFRKLEEVYFNKIILNNKSELKFLSVGGGFQAGVPESVIQIMLSRESDKEGRIFFNRPRLEPSLGALDESIKCYKERNSSYIEKSDFILNLNESFDFQHIEEEQFWKNIVSKMRSQGRGLAKKERGLRFFSLSDVDAEKIKSRKIVKELFLSLEIDKFELRTDLLTCENIKYLLSSLPPERILLSFRDRSKSLEKLDLKNIWVDWDIELGKTQFLAKKFIFSNHPKSVELIDYENLISYAEAHKNSIIKVASPVDDIDSLDEVKEKLSLCKNEFCFFPISKSGKWKAFRILSSKEQAFTFIKNPRLNNISDQEDLLESCFLENKNINYAVLGKPISHSRSPGIAYDFLKDRNSAMLRVCVEAGDLEKTLSSLQPLGLNNYAVTSPLKEEAFKFAQIHSKEALSLEACNSLSFSKAVWIGHNTDVLGFKDELSQINYCSEEFAVWGGGGTLNMLKELLPQAGFFSARTGELREDQAEKASDYKVLVWAISNFDIARACKLPHKLEGLEVLIDLGYKDNSLAREYAIENSIKYINGLSFLKRQAKYQQDFWRTGGV